MAIADLASRAWDGRAPDDVPRWRRLRTDGFLAASARRRPGKEAVRFEGSSVTYGELNSIANRVANGLLTRGARPGDVVGVIAANGIEVLGLLYGIARAGLVILPMNPKYTGDEIRYQMEDAGAKLLVAEGHLTIADIMAGARDGDPEVDWPENQLFQRRFTSGTTGKPKQVATTQRAIATMHLYAALELGYSESDVALVSAPLAHAAFHLAAATVATGGTIVLERNFDRERVWEICDEHQVTTTFMVPTMFALSLDAPGSGQSIRSFLSMSAVFPSALKEKVRARFPRAELLDCYGSTEVGLATLLRSSDPEDKQASVGLPGFGYQIRVLDPDGRDLPPREVGEIYARGPGMSFGYVGSVMAKPNQAVDGFVSAGDLGWLDEDGYLYIVDRRDDMIVSGGLNVYPAEVEDVIMQLDGVTSVAVVGVPDDTWGHLVAAAIQGDVHPATVDRHCRTLLARYKVPRLYRVVDELPINVNGKVLRRAVREMLAADRAASMTEPVGS